MARKTQKKKPAGRRFKKSKTRFLWPLLLLVMVTATLGATAYFIFLAPGTSQLAPSKLPGLSTAGKSRPLSLPPEQAQIAYEEDTLPEVKQKSAPPAAAAGNKPRLALLIDDMGYLYKPGQQLIELDLNLSFAILPFTPHGHSLMEMAHARNREILLHQPMEATSAKWDPGPGTLTTAMSPRSIKAQMRKNLEDVPYAVGVNNHMGSKFTTDREAMQAALATLKARDLFFLDSITIADSVAAKMAREMQIRTGRRDVFIDSEQDETKIKAQLEKLVKIARKHGSAIGIGHPYPATIATLQKEGAWLSEQVQLVGVSSLME